MGNKHILSLGFIVIIAASIFLTGCELLELGELGGAAAVEDAAFLSAEDGIAGATMETGSVADGALIEGVESRAFVMDEPRLMRNIDEVEMRKGVNSKSQLFIRGKNSPFGEVVDQKYIKMLRNGNLYSVRNTIFRVESDNIIVRPGRGITNGTTVATLRNGAYIEELEELGGWYKVRIYKDGMVLDGFIPVTAGMLSVVVVGKDDKKTLARERDRNIDYRTLINTCFINLPKSIEVSVFIADEDNSFSMILSSGIAKIYSDSGYNSNFSFFKPEFANTFGFDELYSGNLGWASKIQLSKYADYIVLGKIKSTYKDGTITVGTRTCNSILEMHVFSTKTKAIVKSFTLNLNGIGFKDEEAKYTSIMHIYTRYRLDYSAI